MNAVVANDYQLCWQLCAGNDAVHAIQAIGAAHHVIPGWKLKRRADV